MGAYPSVRSDRSAAKEGRQQITRIPPYRRGDWVRLRNGRLEQVKSLACIVTAEDIAARWKVFFESGSQVEVAEVLRKATAAELREWAAARK